MKTPLRPLRLAIAGLLILSGCATARQLAPAPALAADNASTGLWQQIQTANTDLSCDSDRQCHTLGVGGKACGGPENYLAWSSKHKDGAQLKALAEQHSAARRAEASRQGMMSTCSVVSDPGASCRAGVCILNPRDVAAPPGPASPK
jgi:hypothetical protein